MLESCMPSFIEVARLESCQKLWELWLEGKRKKEETRHHQPISAKIQSPIKFEVYRISTRSKRHSIHYLLLGI